MWVKEVPKIEGWYLWRKTSKQNDQWKWCAYFVTSNGKIFENGTHVHPPRGGWWSNVPCGYPTS